MKLVQPVLAVAALLMLTACNSYEESVAYLTDSVYINGDSYPLNEDGVLMISEAELAAIKHSSDAVIATTDAPRKSVSVTQAELAVLIENPDVIYNLIDDIQASEVVLFVREGSLRRSLQEFIDHKRWAGRLSWEYEHDFYVHEPFVVRAASVEDAIMTLVSSYEVLKVSIDTDIIVSAR